MREIFKLLLLFVLLQALVFAAYANETPSGIPIDEMGSRIDEVVARYLGLTTPGAAVVVVKDGEIIFSRGYGYADTERAIPVDPAATVFEYGSVSKLFAWVAVMQLAEQGLLDLDATVSAPSHLPEYFFRQLNFTKPFTARDILNHSAGFGEHSFDAIFNADRVRNPGAMTLREGLLVAQPPQIFQPGTASSYSNFGSALAGYIVGHIWGGGFAPYERENIFAPAGMWRTKNQPDWAASPEFLQARAAGYMPDGSGGFRRSIWSYVPMYPAGAVIGTAEDLARFALALTPPEGEAGPLFQSRETLTTLFSPSGTPEGTPPSGGLRGTHHGFLQYNGVFPSFGHAGHTASFSSNVAVVPSERFGLVVLTNASGELDMLFSIQELLLGLSPIPPTAGNLPDAARVAGTFIGMRRNEGNLLEFFSYLSMMARVTAIDENTIEANIMSMTGTYQQVAPYVFRIVSADSPFFKAFVSELHFRMDGDRPVFVSVGNGFDMSALPQGRQMPALIASLAAAAGSSLFFLITPIVLLILFLYKRKKGKTAVQPSPRFRLLSNSLLFCGTLLALNNLICAARILVLPFRSFAEIAPHVWANYVLLIAASLLFAASLWFLFRNKTGQSGGQTRKILHGATVSLIALLFVVLGNWNFFVLG